MPALARSSSGRAAQRGVSLIEVLVAVVVLSLGVLAMAGLQLNSLRTSQGALYRSNAAMLASDIADRIRANRNNLATYAIALTDATPTGTTLRDRDIADWRARLRALPAGQGAIAVNASNVTVTVRWDDSRATGSAANGEYVLTVRL